MALRGWADIMRGDGLLPEAIARSMNADRSASPWHSRKTHRSCCGLEFTTVLRPSPVIILVPAWKI